MTLSVQRDPGPVSTEMMKGIREEIEAVYPDMPEVQMSWTYADSGIVLDEDGRVEEIPSGQLYQDEPFNRPRLSGADVPVVGTTEHQFLISQKTPSDWSFLVRDDWLVSVAHQFNDVVYPPELTLINSATPGISIDIGKGSGDALYDVNVSWFGQGFYASANIDVQDTISGVLQIQRQGDTVSVWVDNVLMGSVSDPDISALNFDLVNPITIGDQAGSSRSWSSTAIAGMSILSGPGAHLWRSKEYEYLSQLKPTSIVIHADVSDPSTVIESGTITSITNKGSLGGQFLPTATAPGVVQVNGLNAAGFVVGIERMELQGPEKEELKFLHDNTVPWQMTVVAKWGTQRQAYADLCGSIGTGGAYVNKRPSSILCSIGTDGSNWSGTSPHGTASEGDVGVVTLRFTPGDPALLELFIDGVLEITSTRAVSVSFPLTSNPTSPFTIGPGESGGDFDVCEIIVEKDHVDRYAELAAKWVAP